MGLYIEKEIIESILDFHHNVLCDIPFDGDTFIDFLVLENFVEAEPVIHSHWRPYWVGAKKHYQCTQCGAENISKTQFCHHCGAKMDEAVE